jgi:transcriptional regulator with XRE-family HTH domain
MKLKEWLTLSGTSQTELARAVAVPVSTINRLLRGRKIPTHDVAVRIYFVTLGAVQPNDFFDLDTVPPEVRPALVAAIRQA